MNGQTVCFENYQTVVGSGLTSPYGVAVDGNGNIYFADQNNDTLSRVAIVGSTSITVPGQSGNGSVLVAAPSTWQAQTSSSWLQIAAATTSGTGNALVQFTYGINDSTAPRTGTFTAAGQTITVTQAGNGSVPISQLTAVATPSSLIGITSDWVGNVYFSGVDNIIYQWSPTTSQVTQVAGPIGLSLSALAVDGQGNLYASDSAEAVIWQWNAASGTSTPISGSATTGPAAPTGLAVDGQGDVYVASFGTENAFINTETVSEWVQNPQQVGT